MGKARLNSSKDDKDGDEGDVGEGKGERRLVRGRGGWYRERDIEGANKRVNKVLYFNIK